MRAVTAVLVPGPVHYLVCALLVCVAVGAGRSPRVRQLALLLASWLFYVGWGAGFLAVLIASSLLNYVFGAVLRRRVSAARLGLGVAMNIALLAFFKYASAPLADEAGLGLLHQLVRPLGISFWTLQALSYLFDIYKEEELEPSLLEFCLYMAFWPTVLSGPISRLSTLLPQFRQRIGPSLDDLSVGASRVLQGLFMKMVLAEILAAGWRPGTGVNAGFDSSNGPWGGLDVWFLAIGFGFQLFFDFAGYSHIVIGAARLIGIRLDENFDRPYLSPTPAAFWTRWHMSLSFWIRDYVFLQMASLRRGRWWVYLSLLLSMVICGLWHNASAAFIVWGAYHGLLLVAHRIGQQVKRSLPYHVPQSVGFALSCASTFALVSLGWLFFRAQTLAQAMTMSRAVFAPGSYSDLSMPLSFYAVTSAIVMGYAMYHAGEAMLTRWRAANASAGLHGVAIDVMNVVLARRWWWLGPATAVVAVFAGLAFSDLRPGPPSTPFMYTLF
jgi:alginate O-acetyltransferase complex protein AlgI